MIRAFAAICLAIAAGCSPAAEPAGEVRAIPVKAVSTGTAATPARPASGRQGATAIIPDKGTGSRVLGQNQLVLRGKPACEVRFVYAGRDPENLFWEEPCAAVTARMLTRRELEALGRWERLDDFARKFVTALPDGKVLYVEGGASASVYPVGTTGSAYEVPVAD